MHDELKQRGQESSEQKYTSARLLTAQRQLSYNVSAYNNRCQQMRMEKASMVVEDDGSEAGGGGEVKGSYGVDFTIDDDYLSEDSMSDQDGVEDDPSEGNSRTRSRTESMQNLLAARSSRNSRQISRKPSFKIGVPNIIVVSNSRYILISCI